MVYEVCGSFETKQEAIDVVNALSLKGFPADRIRVFTSQKDPRELARETDGFIVHVRGERSYRPASRLTRLFAKISNCDSDVHEELKRNGLSERQAEKYTNDIHAGHIVVVADNKLKIGHNRTVEGLGMQSPLMHHDRY